MPLLFLFFYSFENIQMETDVKARNFRCSFDKCAATLSSEVKPDFQTHVQDKSPEVCHHVSD